MKQIKVGDLITFNVHQGFRQRPSNSNTTATINYNFTPLQEVKTAVVMAMENGTAVVLLYDGEKLVDYFVNHLDIIKIISPYNELIEGL